MEAPEPRGAMGSRRASWASTSPGSTDEGVQAQVVLRDWREEAQSQLQSHEQRLLALEERLAGLQARATRASVGSSRGRARASTQSTVIVDMEDPSPDSSLPLTKLEKKRAQNAERITNFGVKISLYEFGMSMWDASILLFIGHVKLADRFLLVAGMVVNIAMQSAMLAVIWRDMLLPDYNPLVTRRLLEWRVWDGHSNATFHQGTGQTKVEMLCNKSLWSFEQAEYNEMYDYLHMPVPGIILSFLAVVLWVLTCVTEYRCISEQFLALRNLPAVKKGEETVRLMEYGTFVLGIEPVWRWVSFFVLVLPRFAVLASLCTVGCIFLCQTVNLADIMLNAVALAFILDIDEALCAVMLSQRLRNELQLMQPMSCGDVTHTCGGVTYKDLGRYLIFVGIVAVVAVQVLFPFHADVSAAATALCGGVRDFTYSGGVPDSPMIRLTSASDWVSSCSADINSLYMSEYYAGFNGSSGSSLSVSSHAAESDRLKALTKRLVLSQAMTGCPVGQLRTPKGRCEEVPPSLSEVLERAELVPGTSMELPDCQRLNVSMGWESCAIEAVAACKWTWKAHKCEGGVEAPGLHHQRACGDDLQEACEEWRFFGKDHPVYNCAAVEKCGHQDLEQGVTCLSMSAGASLSLRDGRFWQNTTAVSSAIREGVRLALNLTEDSKVIVAVDFAVPEVLNAPYQVRRHPSEVAAPGNESGYVGDQEVSYPWESYFTNSTNSTSAQVLVQLRRLPRDMKTENLLGAGTGILSRINEALNSSLQLRDVVADFDWQDDLLYMSERELKELDQAYIRHEAGYCDVEHPLFNCLMCRATSLGNLAWGEFQAEVDGPPFCCYAPSINSFFNQACCDACWTSVAPEGVQAFFHHHIADPPFSSYFEGSASEDSGVSPGDSASSPVPSGSNARLSSSPSPSSTSSALSSVQTGNSTASFAVYSSSSSRGSASSSDRGGNDTGIDTGNGTGNNTGNNTGWSSEDSGLASR